MERNYNCCSQIAISSGIDSFQDALGGRESVGMEVCVKLLTLGCCVSVVFGRGASSTSTLLQAKTVASRGRSTRNALHPRHMAPSNPQFLFMRKAPPSEFSAALHENWVLECEAGGSPPPTIHWLRNGNRLTQSLEESEESNHISEAFTPIMGIGSTVSRLYLDCTGPQDEANYACVAETPYQRTSAYSHVVVTADPLSSLNSMCVSAKKSLGTPARISMWTGNMLETMGNDALLFCRSLGSPSPRVTWLLDDEVLKSSAKYQVQENGDLLIRNIEWNDMGEYVCVAENRLGRDSAATFLYPVKPEN